MIKVYIVDKIQSKVCNNELEYYVLISSELRKMRQKSIDVYKKIICSGHLQNINIFNQTNNQEAYSVFIEAVLLLNYRFDKYKTKKLKKIKISYEKSSMFNLSIVEGVYLARDLVNEPLSFLTASQLSKEIKKAGKKAGFSVKVLNEKKIESLGMGGVLSVNKGSVNPPTFNILSYLPNKKEKNPFVLVGKGVVFDTGGLSLKPTPNSMDYMKSDMGGASTVIGAIYAIAKMNLNINVIGLIPAVENRPGGNAYVPGDVITMMNGSTVEVLNTDAEGRLILADALHYAKRLNPKLVIDVATLTGAAIRAVGKYGIVTMGNVNKKIMQLLEKSGENCDERIAVQPFWDDYSQELESDIADLNNLGSAQAGHITAGKFLEHFTKEKGESVYPWVHMDTAGVSFLQKPFFLSPKGGTGAGVRVLCEFIKKYSSNV